MTERLPRFFWKFFLNKHLTTPKIRRSGTAAIA